MKQLATLLMTTGLLATMIACDSSNSMTTPDAAIEDPTGLWALQSFQLADGSLVPVPDPARYTLDLGATETGLAHIRADCNMCNGGYELSGSTLVLGRMACTLAACPPDSLDNDYLFALGSTSTFQRTGNALTLNYDGGVMRFEAN